MSDNKLNYILFLVLSLAIILGYTYFFSTPPKETVKEVQNAQEKTGSVSDTSQGTLPAKTQNFEDASYIESDIQDTQQGELVTVDTPLYKGTIDTSGARILSWELKDYNLSTNGNGELINLFMNSPPGFSTLLKLNGFTIPELIPFTIEGDKNVSLTEGTKEIIFFWDSPEGIRVNKIYELDASSYVVKQKFEVENTGPSALQERVDILWYGNIESMGRGENSRTFVTMVSQDVERISGIPDTTDEYRGEISWFGYSEKYFMSTFLPETGAETILRLSPTDREGVMRAVFSYPPDTIPAGQTSTRNWEVYLGPLEYDFIKPVGYNLSEILNYGWFGFLAKPLLDFLKWLNLYFHNYGISIIVITVIIRVLFLPLTVKTMVSMKRVQVKMEKIKPKMDALKEKYKDDKAKQNSELMKLYSSHGINPLSSLGGCLPLLIQLPVFIALYDVFLHSIDLRHSAFLWISDLSEPETLFDIPFIGVPFRILPLVMGVSWFLSQKMTPMAMGGNEQMQLQMKMMQFMPIIFTVLFWGLPSGLVLYWTVSNILSIGQQIYVNRKVLSPKGG
jgi:YidC/Oxa1 family membrane protein insertase